MPRADILAVVEDQFYDLRKKLDVQLQRTAEIQLQLDAQQAQTAELRQQVVVVHKMLKKLVSKTP